MCYCPYIHEFDRYGKVILDDNNKPAKAKVWPPAYCKALRKPCKFRPDVCYTSPERWERFKAVAERMLTGSNASEEPGGEGEETG